MDLDVKLAVYHHFAATGVRPSAAKIAEAQTAPSPRCAFVRSPAQQSSVLEADGESIRMAPRFRRADATHGRRGRCFLFRELRVGRARHPSRAAQAGNGAISLRAVDGASRACGLIGGSRDVRLALPLCGARGSLVG